MLLLLVFAVLVPMYPVEAKKAPKPKKVQFDACEYGNGTFRLTATVHMDPGEIRPLWSKKNGGKKVHYGNVTDGWKITFTGIPEGTKYKFKLKKKVEGSLSTTAGARVNTIVLTKDTFPKCPKKGPNGATALFNMWLLTNEEKSCILISEAHPSVESQKASCFPGQEWVAENTLCSGYVYDNGFWGCDEFGFERLPVSELMKIFGRHKEKLEQLAQ